MIKHFDEEWFIDTEFRAERGALPETIALVAKERFSGKTISLFKDELEQLNEAPFNTGKNSLIIAYFASAELNCFVSLGWQMPENIFDAYVEFRNLTNGVSLPHGSGLLGALAFYGLEHIDTSEKTKMRDLCLRGGPWSKQQQNEILVYCESDVIALERLYERMVSKTNLPQALLRGKYMCSVSKMETTGIPMDIELYNYIKQNSRPILETLVNNFNETYLMFEGLSFKQDKFIEYISSKKYDWPRTETGKLATDQDTLKQMGLKHPEIEELRQIRKTISQLREFSMPIANDDRVRTMLSPFRSKTGRNQPKGSEFPFSFAAWLRNTISPKAGKKLFYLDYEQQEFAIAAALSKDPLMIEAYESGDPYLSFAKAAMYIPETATRQSHSKERDLFKNCALAVQYCQGPEGLAQRLQCSIAYAKSLLLLHKETFSVFWTWQDAVESHAFLFGYLESVFGWKLTITKDTNYRTVRNFPMQANGAEMLRLACILCHENNITVCAPVHDALLIECDEDDFETLYRAQACMELASRQVLGNLTVKTDYKEITLIKRFDDPRGLPVWSLLKSKSNMINPETGGVLTSHTRLYNQRVL